MRVGLVVLTGLLVGGGASVQAQESLLPEEVCRTLREATAGLCPSSDAAFPASGQDRSEVQGEDGNPASGAPLAYRDNGDGTLTDLNTGLTWEKKIALDGAGSAADPHDADNRYPWQGSCSSSGTECGTDADCPPEETCDATDGQGTGLTVFEWVAELNAQGFAGHDDWRVPNVRELQSIVHYGRQGPAVAQAFHGSGCGAGCTDAGDPACACTQGSGYWSSTTKESDPRLGWVPGFFDGFVFDDFKTSRWFARAVRGGTD